MTLILKLDLDIVKMYNHTKNEVSMSTASKSYSPNRHTDTQTDRHTNTMKTLPLPHSREVNIWKYSRIGRQLRFRGLEAYIVKLD